MFNSVKLIKEKETEIDRLKLESKKYDEKLIELNVILCSALGHLKKGNHIFKMASTKNFVNQYNIQPRDLINFTIRINKNYSSPAESDNFLPVNFLNPYPLPHVEMNLSFLKFNLDEGGRLKIPVVNPAGGVVKKGSQIEIKYPENIEGVFFRYTTSVDLIPAYFSGEKVNNLNIII